MRRAARAASAACAIVVASATMRPALASLGPVLIQLQRAIPLDDGGAGLLTTVPVLCFGVVSPLAPRLARRLGLEATVMLALCTLVVGVALRSAPSLAALFGGTVLAGAAIACGNVLLPALVKRDFPQSTGVMMGLYSAALSGGVALGTGLVVPLERLEGVGWRAALSEWAVLGVLAALIWTPMLRERHFVQLLPPVPGLWRSALAWQVTAYLGLQSFSFYSLLAWLPTLLEQHQLSAGRAGWLVASAGLVSIPASLLAPVVALRLAHQGSIVALSAISLAVALIGLLVSPLSLDVVWMVLLGAAQGSSISLALTLIVLRARDPSIAAQLSGMAQSAGYLIAAAGPFAVGALRQASGAWDAPLVLLLVLLVVQVLAGLAAARPRLVRPGATPARAAT